MTRIDDVFAALRTRDEKGLVVYLTGGDPDPRRSLAYLAAAAESADVLEIGVPFSEPTADGPTIETAYRRALASGTNLAKVLELVAAFDALRTGVPVVLFGYYNPFFRYGVRRLCRDAASAGVSGVLVVDLLVEEAGEMAPEARGAGLDWIAFASPTSGPARVRAACAAGSGFRYVISVTGITGARKVLPPGVTRFVRDVRSKSRLPVAVGFGISGPEMARAEASEADAVVVGSACVRIVETHGASKEGPRNLGRFVRSLKNALK